MIQPLPNGIAVVPLRDPNWTESGRIFLLDQYKNRIDQGIIKYIGSGVSHLYLGQHVIFSGYTGNMIHIEGEGDLIIMPAKFVVAVIHPDVGEVPDLYFKDAMGNLITCTYESIMQHIADVSKDLPWRKLIHSNANTDWSKFAKPYASPSDYENEETT